MKRNLAIIILTTIFALIYSCKENEGLLTDPNGMVPSVMLQMEMEFPKLV